MRWRQTGRCGPTDFKARKRLLRFLCSPLHPWCSKTVWSRQCESFLFLFAAARFGKKSVGIILAVHRLNALLVGRQFQYAAAMIDWLSRKQRECVIVSTRSEACDLLPSGKYDLVLSDNRLPDGSGFGLIQLLAGFSVTLFISHPVEDSCIWLPAILRGVECWGSGALKPKEFVRLIEEIIAGNQEASKEQTQLRQEFHSGSLASFNAYVQLGSAKFVTARSTGCGVSSAPGTLRSTGAKTMRGPNRGLD